MQGFREETKAFRELEYWLTMWPLLAVIGAGLVALVVNIIAIIKVLGG